jgi:calcineurin-like phosphoesterase family protein
MTERYFFTSDTHFNHVNILKFQPDTRDAKTVEEMNRKMISNWQAQVRPEDHVFHLGDFAFGNQKDAKSILRQLPGRKHFVWGNHDKGIARDKEMQACFETIDHYKKLNIDGEKVILFHFPIYEWEHMHHGAFHFYGHVHGSVTPQQVPGRAMDVGIDTRPNGDLKLWSWEELKRIMLSREIRTHHGKHAIE